MTQESPVSEALQQEIRHLRTLEGTARDPRDRVFLPLADAHLRLGNIEWARELLEDGLTRHPDFVPGHVLMARLLEAEGDAPAAEERWATARRLDPRNMEAVLALGLALVARGERLGGQLVLQARATDPTAGGQEPDADLVSIASLAPAAPDPRGAAETAVVSIADLAPGDGADVVSITELAPAGGVPASPAPEAPATESPVDRGDAANLSELPDQDASATAEGDDVLHVDAADDALPDLGAATVVDPAPDDDPVVDEVEVDEAVVDDVTVDEAAVDEVTVDEAAVDEAAIDEVKVADAPSREAPPAGGPKSSDVDTGAPSETSEADRTDRRVVTRTLAELFIAQGQRERAVEMYEELASRSPDDVALQDRLEELRSDGRHPDESGEAVLETAGEAAGDPEEVDAGSTIEVPAEADAADEEEFDPRLSPAAPDPDLSTPFAWTSSGVEDEGGTPESDLEETVEDEPISDYLGGLLGYSPDRPSDGDPSTSS